MNIGNKTPQQGGGSVSSTKPPMPPPRPAPEQKVAPVPQKPTEGAQPLEKKPLMSKIPRPKISLGKKPKDVKLPEKGVPELSSVEQAIPKEKPPAPPSPVEKKPVGTSPIIETGPVEEKKPKRILKYVVIVLGSLAVLGGIVIGYMYLRNMQITNEPFEEPEVQETTESVVIEEPEEDTTSLRVLDRAFDAIEDELVVLEAGVNFEDALRVDSLDF